MTNPKGGFGGKGLSRELPDPFAPRVPEGFGPEGFGEAARPLGRHDQTSPARRLDPPLAPPPTRRVTAEVFAAEERQAQEAQDRERQERAKQERARRERAQRRSATSTQGPSQRELLRRHLSTRKGLQQSFVLMEILGPPKALRKSDDE